MTQVFFIGRPELRRMLGGISMMTVNRWEAAGHLPRSVHLGPDVVASPYSEVERFAKRLMTERTSGTEHLLTEGVKTNGAGDGGRR